MTSSMSCVHILYFNAFHIVVLNLCETFIIQGIFSVFVFLQAIVIYTVGSFVSED